MKDRNLGCEELSAKFRASRDHETIKANRLMLQEAAAEANTLLAMVRALSQTNRSLCDHKGSRSYTDRGGDVCIDCPHCGGD